MIVAVLNREPATGKTTLAVHLAGELALRGRPVVLADAGPDAGALRWAQARSRSGHAPRFETAGLDRRLIPAGGLPRTLAGLAGGAGHVIVDTPPDPFADWDEVLAAADLVLIPVRATSVTAAGRSSVEAAVRERRRRPGLVVRVVYTRVRRGVSPEVLGLANRAHLVGTAAALGDWQVLSWVLPAGQLVQEAAPGGPAGAALSLLAGELFGRGG